MDRYCYNKKLSNSALLIPTDLESRCHMASGVIIALRKMIHVYREGRIAIKDHSVSVNKLRRQE